MKQSFTAQLQKEDIKGAWTYITVPFCVETIWGPLGSRGYIKVKGAIDGQPFSGINLMPMGKEKHILAIKEAIRKAIGKEAGAYVKVIVEPDTQKLSVPQDFQEALANNLQAKTFFDSLTESNKNYYVTWIENSRQSITRKKRITKSLEVLAQKIKFTELYEK